MGFLVLLRSFLCKLLRSYPLTLQIYNSNQIIIFFSKRYCKCTKVNCWCVSVLTLIKYIYTKYKFSVLVWWRSRPQPCYPFTRGARVRLARGSPLLTCRWDCAIKRTSNSDLFLHTLIFYGSLGKFL